MNLSDPVLAAVIGAVATMVTALIQLRLSWRKELRERERGQPITKKSRRGPVLIVLVLMIASAVGGFALSQYVDSWRYADRDMLREELQAKLAELSASAARLEQARLKDAAQPSLVAHAGGTVRAGEDGTAASIVVGPCRGTTVGDAPPVCAEQSAVRVSVCALVPATATVKEVLLFARHEDSKQSWDEARVRPGDDLGQARFQEKFVERAEGDGAKQVCQGFANWHTEKSRVARILVRYTP